MPWKSDLASLLSSAGSEYGGVVMNYGDKMLNNLLAQSNSGDAEAFTELFRIPINELKRVAWLLMDKERPDYTLHPTEDFLELERRFSADHRTQDTSKEQFVARMVRLMREILAGYLRAATDQNIEGVGAGVSPPSPERSAADEARNFFWETSFRAFEAHFPPEEARIVELKFLSDGLLTDDEIGQLMGVKPETVRNYMECAEDWLRKTHG
jgi:DNA-directed RNA polymerase sigma subunit (sigma70/sigma32)